MGRHKQPANVIQFKGKSHETKAELKERRDGEIEAPSDKIEPPAYLTETQAEHFNRLADALTEINILANIDAEALARYVVAEHMYEMLTEKLQDEETQEDIFEFEKTANFHDKYFKQCRSLASDLGLNITSRCKLVVPKVVEEKPVNRFADFEKASGNGQSN